MEKLETNREFQCMNEEKKRMVLLLKDTLTGKKLTEALPVLVEWKASMQKKGIVFTEQEKELLARLFTEQMTPAQKKQYEFLKPFLHCQ